MKLVQGILPDSLVKDGPDNPITTSPIEHGGYEMGTWCTEGPWNDIKMDISFNIRKPETCSYGVQRCHLFTIDECEKMIAYLQSMKKIPIHGDPKHTYVWTCDGVNEYYNKGYKLLLGLFKNTVDRPVYYWAC